MEHETPEATLGAQVKRLRDAHGWSQEELARRMKSAGHESWLQTTAAKTEAGKRPVRLNEACALAGVLQVPLLDLLGNPADAERSRVLHELLAATAEVREAQAREQRARSELEAAAAGVAQALEERRTLSEQFDKLQQAAAASTAGR